MSVRNPRPRWLKAVDPKGGGTRMTDDGPDKAAALFAEIATEQQAIEQIAQGSSQIAEGTAQLRRVQQAKRDLAMFDASMLRVAIARRHASLVEGA